MSACEVVTLLHGFTCFCTQCWDTVIINTEPCVFTLQIKVQDKYMYLQNTIYIFQFYLQVADLQKPQENETFKKL